MAPTEEEMPTHTLALVALLLASPPNPHVENLRGVRTLDVVVETIQDA